MTELETAILNSAKDAVNKSIVSALTEGYNSPMKKLCEQVLEEHLSTIKELINAEVVETISSAEFKEALKEALLHKLAKTLVSKMQGELEKKVNDLRQNAELRAKLTLKVSELIKEL